MVWRLILYYYCLVFREEEMQQLNRSTNAKMATFSFLSLGVCLSVAGLQLWHLKTFFERKKLLWFFPSHINSLSHSLLLIYSFLKNSVFFFSFLKNLFYFHFGLLDATVYAGLEYREQFRVPKLIERKYMLIIIFPFKNHLVYINIIFLNIWCFPSTV